MAVQVITARMCTDGGAGGTEGKAGRAVGCDTVGFLSIAHEPVEARLPARLRFN